MKRRLLNSIVAGAALLASVNASAQTEKFYLGVTGYPTSEVDADNPVTVGATVYDDFSFVLGLPSSSAKLSANNVTFDIRMTDVASLGVSGTKSISKTISTGLDGVIVTLSEQLPYSYKFAGVTCPVTVKDGSDNQTFIYTIGGVTESGDGYTITGTPSSSADANAAWQLITKHVTTSTSTEKDTYVTIPAGAYIQLGNERLVFEKGYSYLQSGWSLETEMAAVKANAKLDTLKDVTGSESAKMILSLPAGTTLALGSSYATLTDSATITIDASDAAVAAGATSYTYEGYLSALKQASDSGDAALYMTLVGVVKLFDQMVGLFGSAGNVPITVQFGEEVTPDTKFYFSVTGYTDDDDNNEIASTVDFTVYGDYSFVAGLPVAGSEVDADKVRIYSYMDSVQSLNVDHREYDATITTGITGVSGVSLDTYLSNAYAFAGASCPVTVIDGDKSQSFTYYISAATLQSDGTYTITGTPSSTADASTAWHMITANVDANRRPQTGDTNREGFLLMKKGAFLQMGNERAMFIDDCDFLNDTWDASTLKQKLTDSTEVRTYNVIGSDTYRCVIYFPAGCKMTMDETYADLLTPVAVIVDGTSYTGGDGIKNWIANLSTAIKDGTANGVYNLITIFNDIIGLVDAADGADITLVFNPVLVDIFKTTGNAVLGMEVDDLTTLQDIVNNTDPDPNAVAQLICGDLPNVKNLVYNSVDTVYTTYPNANNVCDSLIITDKYPVNIPADIGGFKAYKASYSRLNTNYTNKGGLQAATVCLPFPVESNDSVVFHEFTHIDSTDSLMYFTKVESLAANTPAGFSVSSGSNKIDTIKVISYDVWVPKTDTILVKTEYLTFTGVQTKRDTLKAGGKDSNYYYVAQNYFWRATKNDVIVYPQRAYFVADSSVGAKSFSISFGGEVSTATGITTVQNADATVVGVYNVNGLRQSGLQKGINIVRYADGQTRKVIVK